MRHRAAGIYKGVSEPVYPADILAERDLRVAPVNVKGAWWWCLLNMWLSKTYSVTGTSQSFALEWVCSIEEAERIIEYISASKIATVSRDCHSNVTLLCRRLERRHKACEAARLRKVSQRERVPCHAPVTDLEVTPPSPSPFPSPSPSPDMGVAGQRLATPERSVCTPTDPTPTEVKNDTETATTDHPSLPMLVRQFKARCVWSGSDRPIYEHFRSLLTRFSDGAIAEAIRQCDPSDKPWTVADRLVGGRGRSGDGEMRALLKQVEEDIQRKEAAKGQRR